MRMQNKLTGDTVELPPPDGMGNSVVIFNGRVVEHIRYADNPGRTILMDGRVFFGPTWAHFIIEQLRIGAWRNQA